MQSKYVNVKWWTDEHRQEINSTGPPRQRSNHQNDDTEPICACCFHQRAMHLFSGQAERARTHRPIGPGLRSSTSENDWCGSVSFLRPRSWSHVVVYCMCWNGARDKRQISDADGAVVSRESCPSCPSCPSILER